MTKSDYIWKRKYRDELRRAITALSSDPTTSESISTPNGGSRSVSYTSLASLSAELRAVEAELEKYARHFTAPGGFSIEYTRWC